MTSSSALLPPASSALEHAAAEVFAERATLPVRIGELWNAHTCPAEQLPWLAWALSVDRWFPEWNEAQRRQAIAASYEVHRHKGTPAAVKAALSVLGQPTHLVEWYEAQPPGAPYTFSVEVVPDISQTGMTIDPAWFARVVSLANSAKNTRSHLASVRLILDNPPTPVHIGVLNISAHTIDLYPYQQGEFEYPTPLFAALAQVTHTTIDISPLESTP